MSNQTDNPNINNNPAPESTSTPTQEQSVQTQSSFKRNTYSVEQTTASAATPPKKD